ncbi:hypothetical protein OQA88_4486 [Cercophora sp. LCS_1]
MAAEVTMAQLATLSSESSFSAAATDASSNVASFSSTPPTTVSPDSMSLASEPDVPKPGAATAPVLDAVIPLLEDEQKQQEQQEQQEQNEQSPVGQAIVVAEDPLPTEPPSGRARRTRTSLPVYNLSKLSGTYKSGAGKRRRTVAGDDLATDGSATTADQAVQDVIDALNHDWSLTDPNTPRSARIAKKAQQNAVAAQMTRRATRLSGAPVESLTTKLATLSKRGKKTFEKSVSRMSRELRRLQDTNEFAHIDTRPVRYTVWANGKEVEVDAPEPPRKKTKVDESAAAAESSEAKSEAKPEGPAPRKRRVKKWLDRGLYSGQETPVDVSKGLTTAEKKKLATLPELAPTGKTNKTLPAPMFNGLRLLINGRDFKLPYDVCNPLPPGQPKPAAYRTMTKNRFVGDAAAYWKKTPHFGDFASKCVCKPEDGCAEDCQNRIMLYECDETNCNVGKEHCQNRAFQMLTERTKKGGRYRVGVEVYKTSDRGYGVRSNRCFEPNQIIMEYTGEIITEEECERRMNEVYKDNECYYLMSFDQNMIIDATTGSIARFVNHSCSPNCRMIKWIVSGQPRMALFAGDRPIMTGEELTYDYNFDPFSAKNVQKCLCGSDNCRGVLGPKPKEVKPPKPPKEDAGKKKSAIKAGKRKLKELVGDKDAGSPAKKRKMAKATATKSKSKPVKKVKAAVATVKRVGAKARETAAGFVASRGLKQTKITFKPAGARKSAPGGASGSVRASSGSTASSTIVAAAAKLTPVKGTPTGGRTRTPSRKKLESAKASPATSAGKGGKGKGKAPAQDVYDFPS